MKQADDVIIIGLGAMGSSAAMHLAARGIRVRAFDQFTPPHNHGSSHGRSRIFRQAYFEDARYVPMLLRARELWQSLEQEVGEPLLHTTGALVIGRPGGELVQRSLESAKQFSLPHELLSTGDVRLRYPAIRMEEDTTAILEKNAGYLVPETCVAYQLQQARRNQAALHLDERVLNWHAGPGGEGVMVHTTQGSYAAGRLLITAGPWAPAVLAELGLPLRVTRQVLYWFAPEGDLDDFRPDRFPVYLFDNVPGQPLLYGFPVTGEDTEGVKVALHGTEEICTPQTVTRDIRDEDETAVRQRLATTVPRLAGRLLRAETCLYTMTPDEHFVIDQHPEHPAVTLAAGFSGHGFKFASVVGEVLADLITEGKSAFDLSLFSIERFTSVKPSFRTDPVI